MKGIIFDMDGVLIDAMPFHAEAMSMAINEETGYVIDKKIVYLLEGMPGPGLVKEIFKRENINKDTDDSLAEKISKRKKKLFKQIQKSQAIEGAKELIEDLRYCNCLKAVVSGASKKEIEAILDENIGLKNFNVVIAGDDIEEGKPHPSPFQTALRRMDLKPSEAIVVENAPLGVEAAIRAGIEYIVTLNNTPLSISSDFKGTISIADKERNKIFKDTKSASSFLKEWCCD
ncbi:MAG TPA: HAD family phosphatase [Nitrososphaeraceae archaeon]|nr:HAD family phosphatase [Nitrososphaeraceae archaeon]